MKPFYAIHFCIIPSLFYNMCKAEGTIARNYFAEKNIEHEVRAQIKVFQVFVLVESFEWHNDSSKVLGDVNYKVLVLTLPQRSQEYKPLLSFQSSKYFNDHNYVTVEFDENSHPVVSFFLSANNHCFLITMILFPQNCQNSS